MIDNHTIICATFAGRKNRMSLQAKYMNTLLEQNLVDEWHIWDFARTSHDKKYIYSLENHPKIQVLNKSTHIFTLNEDYEKFYSFYRDNYSSTSNTVLIKQDDDIVYMDLKEFENFVLFRINNKELFLVSANIINNGVCAGIQQKVIPLPYALNPPTGFKYEFLKGELWENASLAHNLHYFFLNNLDLFKIDDVYLQDKGERLSINYFAILAQDFNNIFDCAKDDEHCLTVEKTLSLNRQNAIFLPFVVSHLSFYQQEKVAIEQNVNFNKIYEDYERLYGMLYSESKI